MATRNYVPRDEEILEAISSLLENPGSKAILKTIKSEHPTWILGTKKARRLIKQAREKVKLDKENSSSEWAAKADELDTPVSSKNIVESRPRPRLRLRREGR